MDNRIHRIRFGAWLLSLWFSCGIAILVLLMVNTIIVLLSGFSPIDSMPSAVVDVLISLLVIGMLIGTFFVTTGSEPVKSIASVNIARLLSRGFCVLFALLVGAMFFLDLWEAIFGVRFLSSGDESVLRTLGEMILVLWVPWAGFTALYYAWLYFELGILTRVKARSHAKLLICGGIAIGIVMPIEANSPITILAGPPKPSCGVITQYILSLVVLIAAIRACSMIIGLPYTMKKLGIDAASITADQPRP